jgi:hypothetical protein
VARKVRTPPPPKRAVQAPKLRTTPRDEGRDRKILYAIGGSGFLMLAAVAGFFFLAGNDDNGSGERDAVTTIRASGWTYEKTKSQGTNHVAALKPGFKYNTIPATSGPMDSQTLIHGPYDEPVSDIIFVHNLEHGAVGIRYGPKVPESTVEKLVEYYNGDPNGLILAPDSRLDDKIALTAWTHIAKGTRFDEKVFDNFIDTFGFKGPESCKTAAQQGCHRRSDLKPGT